MPALLCLPERSAARFWSLVNKEGPVHPYDASLGRCWFWTGAVQCLGKYGYFYFAGRGHYTHRVSFEIAKGPLGKLVACHSCDRGLCVNPAHLFAGTRLDNNRDMYAKGRGHIPAAGLSFKKTKLSDLEIAAIRAHRGFLSQRHLSELFEISQSYVNDIQRKDFPLQGKTARPS